MECIMKKLLIATALLSLTALNVNANGIPTTVSYSDVFGNSAGPLFKLDFSYESQSVVSDVDASYVPGDLTSLLTDGDTITSDGGVSVYTAGAPTIGDFTKTVTGASGFPGAVIGGNFITPNPATNVPNNYGVNDEWVMSLSLDGFSGVFDSSAASGNGAFVYNTGTITLFGLYDDVNDASAGGMSNGSSFDTLKELHTYTLTSHTFTNGGIGYTFEVTSVVNDYFSDDYTGQTFATSLGQSMTIFGDILQTAAVPQVTSVTPGAPTTFGFGVTTHNGAIKYSVPEPASIAILGLGLLGFAGASRRKAK
jgi:hypothetical protein